MRQVVLDTETTGISADLGHRVIEIGCVELIARKLTGNHFHTYLNPGRDVDDGAFRVHGISTDFLLDKPKFFDIFDDLLRYIGGAELIIHNAPFDVGFLNKEFKLAKHRKTVTDYCTVLDTLAFAKKKHPGQRNSLDALCKRYDVDNSNRQLHGALLDADILAKVYLAMTGGQTHLAFEDDIKVQDLKNHAEHTTIPLMSQSPVYFANEEEMARHVAFTGLLIKKSGTTNWD